MKTGLMRGTDRRPEIVNSGDRHTWKHAYKLGNEFSSFVVYADCEQDAFDEWTDYCEDKGYVGYFCDIECDDMGNIVRELEPMEVELEYFPDEFIIAGNHCRAIYSPYLWINQIR